MAVESGSETSATASGSQQPTPTSSPPAPHEGGSTVVASERASRRPRRRGPRSLWLLTATWIGGGILGCGLAILILATAFGRDPFGLFGGRTASQNAGLQVSKDPNASAAAGAVEGPSNAEPPRTGVADTVPASGEVTSATSTKFDEPVPPNTFVNSLGMRMVYVPPGSYYRGTSAQQFGRLPPSPGLEQVVFQQDEALYRQVILENGFYLGACEVTRGEFDAFLTATGKPKSETPAPYDRDAAILPISDVTWHDAVAFTKWLSAKENAEYRLPTESEWEYACRAKSKGLFYCGDLLTDFARFGNALAQEGNSAMSDGYDVAAPVGRFAPNGFGLYDMHGNVAEWCSDWYSETGYALNPPIDPPGPPAGTERVVRGGSWATPPADCRSARRGKQPPDEGSSQIGFRVVRVVKDSDPALAEKGEDAGTKQGSPPAAATAGAPTETALPVEPVARLKPEAPLTEPAPVPQSPRSFENSLGMKMLLIPAGEFLMGTEAGAEVPQGRGPTGPALIADEQPQHRVRISRPFYMAAHEVTVEQFRTFTKDANFVTRSEEAALRGGALPFGMPTPVGPGGLVGPPPGGPHPTWKSPGFSQQPSHPVLFIRWGEAIAFVEWLSARENRPYRLPTEAEWEYACRAGSSAPYAFGNDPEALGRNANVADAELRKNLPQYPFATIVGSDGHVQTAPVGSYPPNALGLFDMHGNVWEWCSDRYDETYYAHSPQDDPTGPAVGTSHIYRGGGWDSTTFEARSAARGRGLDQSERFNVGFRVVCDLPADSVPEGGSAPTFLTGAPTSPETSAGLVERREPMPSPELQDSAEKRLRTIFAQEFEQAKSLEQKADLASTLLDQADELSDDLPARFVVLRTARSLAIEAGDAEAAMRSTKTLTRLYEVDEFDATLHSLSELAESVRDDFVRRDLAEQATTTSRGALEEKRFDVAGRSAQLAATLAAKLRNEELKNETESLKKEISAAEDAWNAFAHANETLATNPDDLEARRICGYYLCLNEGDWEAGLPRLAGASDPLLREAVELDLAKPATAEALIATADAWYAFAVSATANAPFMERALARYEAAHPQAAGLDRLHVEKRLAELQERYPRTTEEASSPATESLEDLWTEEKISSLAGSPVVRGSDLKNMFGRGTRNVPDGDCTLFAPTGGGVVHFAEWYMNSGEKVERIVVRLRHDPGDDGASAARDVRVYHARSNVQPFELIANQALRAPYERSKSTGDATIAMGGKPEEIELTFRVTPTSGPFFRLEFVQHGRISTVGPGVRVVEVDAYAN